MWKGYRQLHAPEADLPFLIAALHHPDTKELLFTQLFGLPFGLSTSVVQFNRVPSLLTAVARRCLAILLAHYFDDNAFLDYRVSVSNGQRIFRSLCNLLGVRLSTEKAVSGNGAAIFLGLLNDLQFLPR
eukprot:1292256-Karenia_brevis.AAC.1